MPFSSIAGSRSMFAVFGVAAFSLVAVAQDASTVRVGKETKKTTGLVMSLENGDVACYLTLRDELGKEFMELGRF